MSKPFTWSYSALTNFETCPKQFYHYKILKDVSDVHSANIAGSDDHAHFEARVKHGTPLPLDLARFEGLITSLVEAPGKIYAEQKLALTSSFTPTGFFAKNVWFRTVIDCTQVNGGRAVAIDWKTGKPKEDITQLQLISATLFYHMPALAEVRSALMFLGHNETVRRDYYRSDLTGIWAGILPRVKKLEQARQAQEYPPTPNGLCRKWCKVVSCPFHGRGG